MTNPAVELHREARARAPEIALVAATATATAMILFALAVLLVDILIGGAPVVSWKFLSSPPRGLSEGGILPAVVGTVVLTLLMTVAAVPAGVATAVYLTEYAPPDSKLARVIRVCIANLAGVPSIVFGLFGLGFFISTVGKGIDRAFLAVVSSMLRHRWFGPRRRSRFSRCPSSWSPPKRRFAPCRARSAMRASP